MSYTLVAELYRDLATFTTWLCRYYLHYSRGSAEKIGAEMRTGKGDYEESAIFPRAMRRVV